jgi:hypothetical protein
LPLIGGGILFTKKNSFMAKKKSSKRKPVRRRRIGSMAMNANSPLVTYGSIAAGFVLGAKIDTMLTKVVPAGVDPKIVAGAEIGIGALLVYSKGKKTMLKTVTGGILLGAGIKKATTAFGIAGYNMVPAVAGYNKVPAVSGYNPNSGMNGYTTAKVAVGSDLMDSSRMR